MSTPGGRFEDVTAARGLTLEGETGSYFKSSGVPIRWMAPEAFAFRGTPSVGPAGIFLGDTGTHEARPVSGVRIGAEIDGTGLTYKTLKDPVVSRFGCTIAFGATVAGSGVIPANNAVLMAGIVDGPPPSILAREGELAPGANGGVWKTFTSLAAPCGFTGPIFTAQLINKTVVSGVVSPSPSIVFFRTATKSAMPILPLFRASVSRLCGVLLAGW